MRRCRRCCHRHCCRYRHLVDRPIGGGKASRGAASNAGLHEEIPHKGDHGSRVSEGGHVAVGHPHRTRGTTVCRGHGSCSLDARRLTVVPQVQSALSDWFSMLVGAS